MTWKILLGNMENPNIILNRLTSRYKHFTLEDFNKRIMTPELTTEELESLHKEATDLYDLYFRSNAKHKVNVNQEIAMDIFKSKLHLK